MTPRSYDALVVGAGVLGAATARELAGRGARVALLEQDLPGHAGGSSHGNARMRVPAAYPDETYLERGLRAGEGWEALERDAGERLLCVTGCLSWGEGQDELAAALARHGLAFERWDAADARRRGGGVTLPPGVTAIHQPDGATIRADRALRALLDAAVRRGAELHARTRVVEIEPGSASATVATPGGRLRAEAVVLCAGPWTPSLLGSLGVDVPLRVTRQTVSYFELGAVVPPGLIEYGPPDPYACWSPGGVLKAAEHAFGPETEADVHGLTDGASAARVAAWCAARLGEEVAARRVRVETCRYTVTPDERFVTERHGPVVVGSACSGHGFQYVPDTARRLADLTLDP